MAEELILAEYVQSRILVLRGQRVILDADLAALYGMPAKRLNEQVKRNTRKFPEDFVFQLTVDEKTEVVAKCDHLMTNNSQHSSKRSANWPRPRVPDTAAR